MRSRITHLMLGIFMLIAFVQCKDSVTQTNEPPPNQNTNLENSSLEQPVLITPESGSEHPTSLTVAWAEVDEIEQYQIQMSTDEDFTSTVVDSVVDTTAVKVSNLASDTLVHWQVRSLDNGREGPWSESWRFKTVSEAQDSGPISTDLKTPSNGSEVRPASIELKWEPINAATEYNVQLADDQNFETILVDKKLEDNSYQASDLDHQEDYYWRVEPIIPEEETEWSVVYEFITTKDDETVPATSLNMPEDGSSDQETTVNLSWEEISGIDSYKVQLSTDESFSSPTVDEDVANTSYEVSGLENEQTYYWRVQATSDNNTENWSQVYAFTTKPESVPAATLTTPEDGSGDQETTVNLSWEGISGIDSYKVQLSKDESFSSPTVDEDVANTSYEVSGLENEQTYYWRVQATGDNDAENWSKVYNFTTKSEPTPPVTLISPDDEASDLNTTLNFEWEEISDITDYKLQLADNESFAAPIVDEIIGSTSYDVNDLDNGQTYYWRVQAENDNDSENWSTIHSFSTKAEQTTSGGDYANSVEGDRQALMDLYEMTGGNYWNNNSGWGSGDPSDSWYGVETNSQGRVVRLNLPANNLTGSLPESIGNLKELRYINIKQNKLTGEIPSTIENWSNIEWLMLSGRYAEDLNEDPQRAQHPGKSNGSGNDFSGVFPDVWSSFAKLKYFQLSGSSLTHIFYDSIGEASELLQIHASWNSNLDQQLPSALNNLTKLQKLYLRSNALTGNLPSLSNLTDLRFLHLGSGNGGSENRLTGELPDFSNNTMLREIILDKNNLSGEWPHYWNNGEFNNLIGIRATWNDFTGTLHGFDNLSVRTFAVDGNNLTGTIENILSIPSNARIIGLGWNDFEGEIPQNGWQDFSSLKTIYLANNNFTGGISCEFWEKLDNPKLKIVYIQNNNIETNCTSSMNSVEGNGDVNIAVSGNNF